jgi:very-short-patch-repair endonuclease
MEIGPYIADFVCREQKLVIEIDGGQHAGSDADQVRTAYLEAEGYRVLRFWNNDVLANINGVLEALRSSLACPSPHPSAKADMRRQWGEGVRTSAEERETSC